MSDGYIPNEMIDADEADLDAIREAEAIVDGLIAVTPETLDQVAHWLRTGRAKQPTGGNQQHA